MANPQAQNDTVTTPYETPVTIDVLANDSDPEGEDVVIDSFTQPANGSVNKPSSDQEVSYDFDDGTLQGWVIDDRSMTVRQDEAFSGNYSLGIEQSNANELGAHIEPEELSGGKQTPHLHFYYRETSSSHGGGLGLKDSNGNIVLSVGTTNPDYQYYMADGTVGLLGKPSTSDYDVWVRVDLDFDWENSTVTITFTDTESGEKLSSTESIPDTNIARLELVNNDRFGTYADSGSYVMWYDDISFTVEGQVTAEQTTLDVEPLGRGLAVVESGDIDRNVNGYFMYTEESAHTRTGNKVHRDQADHLLAVEFRDGAWYYDNNSNIDNEFTPRGTDHLVVAAVWGVDNAQSAEFITDPADEYEGITRGGVVDTDMEIALNQYGSDNSGEFGLQGTYITVQDGGDPSGLIYTPNDGFSGEDTFEYTVTDGTATATANVVVTVQRGDAPTIQGVTRIQGITTISHGG